MKHTGIICNKKNFINCLQAYINLGFCIKSCKQKLYISSRSESMICTCTKHNQKMLISWAIVQCNPLKSTTDLSTFFFIKICINHCNFTTMFPVIKFFYIEAIFSLIPTHQQAQIEIEKKSVTKKFRQFSFLPPFILQR